MLHETDTWWGRSVVVVDFVSVAVLPQNCASDSPTLVPVTCMTSLPVQILISKLEHWISLLASVQSSLKTQVSLLDLALSNLNFSQPSSLVIQNIHSICEVLTNQLSEVLWEISDLELAKNLLITTQSSIGDYYVHRFRLSDHWDTLRNRAAYYQELSELFESIYHQIYRTT